MNDVAFEYIVRRALLGALSGAAGAFLASALLGLAVPVIPAVSLAGVVGLATGAIDGLFQ